MHTSRNDSISSCAQTTKVRVRHGVQGVQGAHVSVSARVQGAQVSVRVLLCRVLLCVLASVHLHAPALYCMRLHIQQLDACAHATDADACAHATCFETHPSMR